MERRDARRLPLADPRTEEFLTAAFRTGAHKKVRELITLHPRVRRAVDALCIYLREDVNFVEVGQKITPPSSHETARKLAGEALKQIWDVTGEQVQAHYPLDTVPLRKPFKGRERFGKLSPSTIRVAMVATQGAKFDELSAKAGVENHVLPSKRTTLKKRGIDVPYKYRSPEEYARIVDLITNPSTPRQEYERLVTTLSFSTLQHLTHKGVFLSLLDALNENGYFVAPAKIGPLKDFLLAEGLVLHRSRVIKSGKHKGLLQNFYLVPRRDIGNVGNRLSEETIFDSYKNRPVSKIAGPETKDWATTNDFVKKTKRFSLVADLFTDLGLANRRRQPIVPYSEFFDTPEVPVPVFAYDGKCLFPTHQREELARFINERKKQLGL